MSAINLTPMFGQVAAALLLCAAAVVPSAAPAQVMAVTEADGVHAGTLEVPINRSQVIRVDRVYSQALIGNPEIADVLPLTNRSLYVLGKKMGTTSLTLYDRNRNLIAVLDVAVGPDVMTLRRQLGELLPNETIGARISNDSIVLTGVLGSAPAVKRANDIAETYAPGKVVNMMSVGSVQQVMLEVRFSEMKRGASRNLGIRGFFSNDSGSVFGAIGPGASIVNGATAPVAQLDEIVDSFGVIGHAFRLGDLNIEAFLDALERKGMATTLAEPMLVALSGDTASFLAGGEFPIPVVQDGDGDSRSVSVQFKPFGVSLAFTPTVLEDGVINLVVAPEVSSIDSAASITLNNLVIPGLQTRRARTTVELRDGESFAMAGLIRKDFQDTVNQVPVLGSIPIIGTLFRSTSFRRDETELVIIVTPRLVKPVRGQMAVPSDRARIPNELELFLGGRTDTGVSLNPIIPTQPSGRSGPPIGETNPPIDGSYGHILE